MTNDQTTTTENMNDAIHRLRLALGAAQTDLMTTTSSLLTALAGDGPSRENGQPPHPDGLRASPADAPYTTERLAEAIGAIEGLKIRLLDTLRLIDAYQRGKES